MHSLEGQAWICPWTIWVQMPAMCGQRKDSCSAKANTHWSHRSSTIGKLFSDILQVNTLNPGYLEMSHGAIHPAHTSNNHQNPQNPTETKHKSTHEPWAPKYISHSAVFLKWYAFLWEQFPKRVPLSSPLLMKWGSHKWMLMTHPLHILGLLHDAVKQIMTTPHTKHKQLAYSYQVVYIGSF